MTDDAVVPFPGTGDIGDGIAMDPDDVLEGEVDREFATSLIVCRTVRVAVHNPDDWSGIFGTPGL